VLATALHSAHVCLLTTRVAASACIVPTLRNMAAFTREVSCSQPRKEGMLHVETRGSNSLAACQACIAACHLYMLYASGLRYCQAVQAANMCV
jgi:hypothetical protein